MSSSSQNQETSSSSTRISSDAVVGYTIRQGMQRGILSVVAGLTVGGLASIVLARGASSRKLLTGFGGGVGLGSAWTKCSIELEQLLKDC